MKIFSRTWAWLVLGTVISGCGGSVNKFSYADRRTPQLITPSLELSGPMGGGQKPTQVARSVNFGVRGARYLGPIRPTQGSSASFIVRTGEHHAQ